MYICLFLFLFCNSWVFLSFWFLFFVRLFDISTLWVPFGYINTPFLKASQRPRWYKQWQYKFESFAITDMNDSTFNLEWFSSFILSKEKQICLFEIQCIEMISDFLVLNIFLYKSILAKNKWGQVSPLKCKGRNSIVKFYL